MVKKFIPKSGVQLELKRLNRLKRQFPKYEETAFFRLTKNMVIKISMKFI